MSFTVIQIKELPAWMKAFEKEGITDAETILDDLTLIDDLLVLQKSKALLNRKKNLKQQLEARIGMSLGHKTQNLNVR